MLSDEDAFQAALDANPADGVTRLVFADWLDDRGDERAGGCRAIARLGVWPEVLPQHETVRMTREDNASARSRCNQCWMPVPWFLGITPIREADWWCVRMTRRDF